MHRLFIVIPIYAAVVIFLPQQYWFRPFADEVAGIHPDVTLWVSLSLGMAAILGLWIINRYPFAWMFRRPRVTEVIAMGLLGVTIASIFDVFERLGNVPTSLVNHILLPTGFMISEAAFLAIQWRIQRKDMSGDD
jgi:predicted MFS family arabinose efflux permease